MLRIDRRGPSRIEGTDVTRAQPPQAGLQDTLYPTTYFGELSPATLNYVAALGGFSPRSSRSDRGRFEPHISGRPQSR